MNYYYIDASLPYLATLAEWLLATYPTTLDQVTVLLPSGALCNKLQLKIAALNERTYAFLPEILTIDTFLNNLGLLALANDPCGPLEERIIIAKKLTNFSGSKISWSKAFAMSTQILKLIEQLYLSNKDYTQLSYDLTDSPKFLSFVLEFLQDINHQWCLEIKELGKVDKARYQVSVLQSEIIRQYLKGYNKPLLIAGITEQRTHLQEFTKIVADLNRGTVVLPPLTTAMLNLENTEYPQNHGLYLMQMLSKNYDLTNLKPLSTHSYNQAQNKAPLAELLETTNIKSAVLDLDTIKYITVDNEFEELNLVAMLAKHLILHSSKVSKVAIVTDNIRFAGLLNNSLARYGLVAECSMGYPLKETKVGELVIALINYAVHVKLQSGLAEFFILLKLGAIASENVVHEVEKIALKASITNEIQLLEHLQDYPEFKQWYLSFQDTVAPLIMALSVDQASFQDLLRCTLATLESLSTPKIWQTQIGAQAAKYFANLLKMAPLIGEIATEEFYLTILLSLEENNYYPAKVPYRDSIAIINGQEALLGDYQHLIICECHEGNWPRAAAENHWMPRRVLDLLELDSQEQQSGFQNYLFYTLLNKAKVYLTRAKKYQGYQ